MKRKKNLVTEDWLGKLESKEKNIYITELGRLHETDFISVSREHSNTRFQLAVPLASVTKHHQPNREINTVFHLVGVIFEAHFWEE